MTASDIRSTVLAAIGSQWDRTNLHGVSLRTCLVDPVPMKFISASGDQEVMGWLVLLEHPDQKNGYAVVYDEPSGQFGLAQILEGYDPCLFGLYGDFFSALDAM